MVWISVLMSAATANAITHFVSLVFLVSRSVMWFWRDSMCTRSKWRRTVSQTCGNSSEPKYVNAFEWQRAAAYSLSVSCDALASPPENASCFKRWRVSSKVPMVMSSNTKLSGRRKWRAGCVCKLRDAFGGPSDRKGAASTLC